MYRIEIVCDPAIGKALLRTLAAIQAVNTAAAIELDVDPVWKKRAKQLPRTCYRVVDVANAAAVMKGMSKQKALIWGHLLDCTVRAAQTQDRMLLLTKQRCVEELGVVPSSAERAIGDFVRDGLAVAEPYTLADGGEAINTEAVNQ